MHLLRGAAWRGLAGAGLLAAVLPTAAGCVPSKVATATSPDIGKYRIASVAVLPFEALPTPQVTDAAVTVLDAPEGMKRSDISLGPPPLGERLDRATSAIPAQATTIVAHLVYDELLEREGLRIFSPDEAGPAVAAVRTSAKDLSPEQVASRTAARLSADAALLGKVLIYKERAGSKFGGEPATVGFEVKLVAADGELLWLGNYYEKQRPMIEDFLGFLQRRGTFVTAEELAHFGAEHVMRQFPFGKSPK